VQQYIYRIQPTRPSMLAQGPTARETEMVSKHFAYLQALLEAGTVLMAGRTTNDDDRAFGIVVFVAETHARALEIVENDPAVRDGMMRAELFPYRVALWSLKSPDT